VCFLERNEESFENDVPSQQHLSSDETLLCFCLLCELANKEMNRMIMMRQMGGRMGIKRVAATGWQYHERLDVTDRCHPMLDERKKGRR
jgi:hypothetical protein